MTGDGTKDSVRLLVVAPHPFRLDDLDIADRVDVAGARLVRRPKEIATAFEDLRPNVVIVETGMREDGGIPAIQTVLGLDADIGVLALTPDPPPYDQVARATRAGARGFIDVHAAPDVVAEAIGAVRHGGLWFPPEEIVPILDDVGVGVEMTSSERRSRLTGIMLGLVPLAGVLTALMAFLWRRYAGQLGVRPVDIAVDPASRIIDAIASMLLLLGVFGPLLLIGTWLTLLGSSRLNRGFVSWLLEHRILAWLTLAVGWLAIAWVVALGPDYFLVVVVGPLMAIAIIARAADLDREVPPVLRIQASPTHVLVAAVAVLLLFLGAAAAETFLVGPALGRDGEGGFIVPRIIGFSAQPVEALNVDSGETRQLLYLGGNADLYVLVDPCNDNEVEFVSVGSHRIEVIDQVTCVTPDDP